MTRDLRTLIYLLNLELREECSRTLGRGMGWNPVCNRGAAVEEDAFGRAAVEADAIGEQQLKRMQSGSIALAVEADAIGSSSWRRRQTGSSSGSGCRNRAREQQLKRT